MSRPAGEAYSFYSKLVGVTKKNDDGTDRQLLIRACLPGDHLKLIRQPNNPFDKNAVFVARQNGTGIGYLDRRTAEQVAKELDADRPVHCVVTEVTGGVPDKPTRGLNVVLVFGVDDLSIILSDGDQPESSEPSRRHHNGGCGTAVLIGAIAGALLRYLALRSG